MPGFLPAIRTTELVWLNHDDDGVEDDDDDVRDGSDDFPAHSLLTKATQTPKWLQHCLVLEPLLLLLLPKLGIIEHDLWSQVQDTF